MSFLGNILIIDDEESMRIACVQVLTEAGYRAQAAENGEAGLELCMKEAFDVVLLDLVMPGIPGIEVLKVLRKKASRVSIVIITAFGTIETAVNAMKIGASDFLAKPFSPEALVSTVSAIINENRSSIEDACALQALNDGLISDMMIGKSDAMRRVALLIRKVAPLDSTVLITGDTGSGKELVARTIHRLSPRKSKPFVTVDCGSLVETLFESEMFGHVKGAFTGAGETTTGKFLMADGGTVFLDEISNISIAMQARLLRVIQEREIARVGSSQLEKIDVRIISATNKNLPSEIKKERFREDLFYRLNVFHIDVPPLRERIDDIPLLTEYFIKGFCLNSKRPIPKVNEEVIRFLKIHDWPGNVRELKNALERAIIVCENDSIKIDDLKIGNKEKADDNSLFGKGTLNDLEREQIVTALRRFKGHKSMTAKYLGINRKTLREKILKYNIKAAKNDNGEN
jgi:two-component system, NtrC family, response regulator HydG